MKNDPELEKSLVEYQNVERQLQNIMLQKHQLQLQVNEIKLAEDELRKASGEVFKSIGSIMIKSSAEDAKSDLKERKELSELRLNTLTKQEEKFRTHLASLQKKLEEKMKGGASNG